MFYDINESNLFIPCNTMQGVSLCREENAPSSIREKELCTIISDPYTNGLVGETRPTQPGQNSGVLTVLVLTFLFVAFSFKHYSRLFKHSTQDLWSMRRRENAFDEHTSNETRTLIAMLIQLWVYEGVLLFGKLSTNAISEDKIFPIVVSLIGLSAVFYLLQLFIYNIIGYVFSDKVGTSLLIKGFNASQILLGITLLIPAFVSIFYPGHSAMMFNIAFLLYFIARVIFICKGFRIFYHNFSSLLYFILYLCTLEIIPVILVYSGAASVVGYMVK